jgi:hypothetical protein
MQVPVERVYILKVQRQIDPAIYASGSSGYMLDRGSSLREGLSHARASVAIQGHGADRSRHHRIGKTFTGQVGRVTVTLRAASSFYCLTSMTRLTAERQRHMKIECGLKGCLLTV